MTDALTLLQKAAHQFRYYEQNHRNKASRLASASLLTNGATVADTLQKADVNKHFADEIERFLAGDAGSSGILGGDLRSEITSALLDAHNEIVALRSKVEDLKPQAAAYRTIEQLAMLTRVPEPPRGYNVDTAWRMSQLVDRLREKQPDREEAS